MEKNRWKACVLERGRWKECSITWMNVCIQCFGTGSKHIHNLIGIIASKQKTNPDTNRNSLPSLTYDNFCVRNAKNNQKKRIQECSIFMIVKNPEHGIETEAKFHIPRCDILPWTYSSMNCSNFVVATFICFCVGRTKC